MSPLGGLGVGVARGSISKMYKVLTPRLKSGAVLQEWLLEAIENVYIEICTSSDSAVKQMFPTNWESKHPGGHLLQAVEVGEGAPSPFLFHCHTTHFSPGLTAPAALREALPLIHPTLLTDDCT